MHEINRSHRYQTALKTTLISVGINFLLALLKIVVGYLAFSNALIADGIHSVSDLITDGLVIVAAKMGNQLPDKDHPYGHQRIETIGVIIISLVLIGAGISIIYDAMIHLLHPSLLQKTGLSAAIIAVFSIVINEWLYRYTLNSGQKTHSDLLKSNAWHHRIDALSSIIVLISIFGSMLGFTYLDPIGAILIGLWIIKIGAAMTWTATKELIDTAVDEHTQSEIIQFVMSVSGVMAIHQLRTRLHGSTIFVDLHIQVMPNITVSE